ncbi:unnamed protein product [Leptidea sinapis]|uniref:Glucuronosyltransferase n=1 Tax=Leptidea sinapis TaxID=189913 RepID=A0A5E4QQF4_9NEOP|nr:unnamed protein product [Leptidea sinapis]
MLFVNTHPMWNNNQPLPPNDLRTFLDLSKQGVIYLSFGSNAPSSKLPPEIIQLFIRVFSNLPYNVLWKWEKNELPGRPQNVKISKWFPQSDLLNCSVKHRVLSLLLLFPDARRFRYKENILKLRTLLSDEPEKALDRAIWWTEYVLRHNGAKHLRSPVANMSWIEYYEIQLILTVLIFVFVCSIVLAVSVFILWKYILRNWIANMKIKTAKTSLSLLEQQ